MTRTVFLLIFFGSVYFSTRSQRFGYQTARVLTFKIGTLTPSKARNNLLKARASPVNSNLIKMFFALYTYLHIPSRVTLT